MITNEPLQHIDYKAFQGKWYSITSIPTFLDKKWRQTIENYVLKENHFEVLTTYKKIGKEGEQSIKSKLFFYPHKPNGAMKAQFWWPIKVAYWVIELPDDYSYVVIGHPDKKYLFIMSRKPVMDKKQYDEVVERCAKRGYNTAQLVNQEHK